LWDHEEQGFLRETAHDHGSSAATDYPYSAEQVGGAARLKVMELPEEIAARCVRLSKTSGWPSPGLT
jgi:hypothetical protein